MIQRLLIVIIALIGFAGCSSTRYANEVATPDTRPQASETTVFSGAQVWTGSGFERRDFAMQGTDFVEVPKGTSADADMVDLSGKYVFPPFGDAHTHRLEGTGLFEMFNREMLSQGVFFAQNPLGLPRLMRASRELTERPDTVDATYGMGGFTTPFGHPERGFVEFMTQYAYRGETRESLRGTAVHAVKSEADVDIALQIVQRDGADFVKVVLQDSENYPELSVRLESIGEETDQLTEFDHSGMNPALLPYLVERAHRAGLPVKAHVSTAHDFRVAVDAGVDEILHMPGANPQANKNLSDYRLSREDALKAASARIPVVATAAVRLSAIAPERREAVFELHRHNIRAMLDNGVEVLIGIDNFGASTRAEIDHLRSIKAMSDSEILQAWIETGVQIFPSRKLGRIAPGYEASFLVVDADPLVDFSTLDRIERRIKEGHEITLAPPVATS